jgi:peptidoglycan/xylan/chitin deacetylase (PgdA/CDA1 family)
MLRHARLAFISLFVLLAFPIPAMATSQQTTESAPGQNDARPAGDAFTPIGPVRIVDSRIALGVASDLKAGVAATFDVAGVLGIPKSAVAVSGNLTVTRENHSGFVSLTTDPTNTPGTSTLNITQGDTRSNGVYISLSSTGKLSATAMFMNCAIVFDVTGYFSDDNTQSSWYPLVPARLLDTRGGIGLSGTFSYLVPRVLQVTGFGGVPVGATAITGNLTEVNAQGSGWVAITVDPTTDPGTSTLNFPVGDIRANNVVAPLSSGGSIAMTYRGGGTTDLVFDVTGYFMHDYDGGLFVPMAPTRVMDSRTPLGLAGPFVKNKPGALALAGSNGIDQNTVAITGNLTATNVTTAGFAYVVPTVASPPSTSNLNVPRADVRANGFVGVLAANQSLAVGFQSASGGADLVIDLTGYFVAPPRPTASAVFTNPAPGTSPESLTSGSTVTWTQTGTVRSAALSQFSTTSYGANCSASTWVVGTTVTPTATSQSYTNYTAGHCYRYAITLNGDPATTVYSGMIVYPPPAGKIPVLEYHRVSPTIDPGSQFPGLVVDPVNFDAQMKALHDNGWRTITAADMGARLAAHAYIPDRTFVITFDDGRDDGYFYAYPILKKYGFVATYYLIVGRTGTAQNISWDQAAEMASNGMEIATHTSGHTDVLTLNAAGLDAEIGGSKAYIESNLATRGVHITVTTFCYPYGDYSTAAEQYLSAHGFTAAFTENWGAVRAGMNMEALPRVRVSRGEAPATLLSDLDQS